MKGKIRYVEFLRREFGGKFAKARTAIFSPTPEKETLVAPDSQQKGP